MIQHVKVNFLWTRTCLSASRRRSTGNPAGFKRERGGIAGWCLINRGYPPS